MHRNKEMMKFLVNVMGTIGVSDGRPYQYQVHAWTNVDNKCATEEVPTEGDPEFNEELQLYQNGDDPAEFLYVDVFKTNMYGTSFVGRGKTLLPTVKNVEVYREIELTGGPEETGMLQLSLYLRTFELLGYHSS